MPEVTMTVLKFLGALLAALCAYHFYSQETFSEEMVRGKRVLVTGSSTGIGEQMAYEFARMGAHVMVTARREEQLRKVVRRCLDLGASSASYIVSDMKNLTSAQRLIEETKTVLGGLDHLVLNHVGGSDGFRPFKGDMETVITSMTINFFSYVQLTVSALDMLKESRGSIVVVSSMSAKFALEGFFSSLRTELRLRKVDMPITVAVLGYIDTDTALKLVGGKINMQASPKEDCAREIVKGGVLRQREVFYPYWTTKPTLILRDWMPELLELFIGKAYVVENIL